MMMNQVPGLGLPLRSAVTVWKKDRILDSDGVISVIQEALQTWYGSVESERTERGLRATLPLVRHGRRTLSEWTSGATFGNARFLEIAIDPTERAFHITVAARTTSLVPVLATFGAFVFSIGVHAPAWLAPLIGAAAGLLAWGSEWWTFHLGVMKLGYHCDTTLAARGRLTSA
jgi:hypothetical protein